MAAAFLVLLVLAWLALCLRAAARARDSGVIGSTDSFKRGLELIGPDHHPQFLKTYGRPAPVTSLPQTEDPPIPVEVPVESLPPTEVEGERAPDRPVPKTTKPARDHKPLKVRLGPLVVLAVLLAGVVLTLGLALFGSGWELHLAFDAALALYVSWLFEDQHRRAVERRRKVTALPTRSRTSDGLRLASGDR